MKDCEARAGVGSNEREACFQMLYHWKNQDPMKATVARLADGIWNAKCGDMLKHLIPK